MTELTDAYVDLACFFLAPDQSSGTNDSRDFAAFNRDSLVDTVGFNYTNGPIALQHVDFLV